MKIDLRPSLLGRLRTFFYKPPVLRFAAVDSTGRSVAIDGSTIIVGARREGEGESFVGAAYIFERTDEGWVQVAKSETSEKGWIYAGSKARRKAKSGGEDTGSLWSNLFGSSSD